MKIIFVLIAGILCAFLLSPSWAMEEKNTPKPNLWTNNFDGAKKQAINEGKDVLIVFSGSDWCEWCIRLKKYVLSTPEFEKTASRMFVLMEADFPLDRSKPTPEIAAQNERLQAEFGVDGKFPTIILLDHQGKPYARTGYFKGAVTADYLEILKTARAGRETRDAAWKKAESAQGLEKAKCLAEGLAGMDDKIVATYYGSVTNEIRKLDPLDSSGFVRRSAFKVKLADLEGIVRDASLESSEANDTAKLIDDFISSNKLKGEELQQAMMLKIYLYPARSLENINRAIVLLDQVIAIDAVSKTGKEAAEIKPRAEMFKKRLGAPSASNSSP